MERERGLYWTSPGGEMVVGERVIILCCGAVSTSEPEATPGFPNFFILVEPNLVAAKLAVVKVTG